MARRSLSRLPNETRRNGRAHKGGRHHEDSCKETIFTDESGKVVSYETIKDSPVTVQYTRDGDRMIVTKVMKQPTVRKETTTTTTTTE